MEYLNDEFIGKLRENDEKLFTHAEAIMLNGVKAKLCLRVRNNQKTFLLKYGDTKSTIGNWHEDYFNFDEAKYKAMKIIKGELTEEEFDDAPTFRTMIHEVLDYKDNVLQRKSTLTERYRLKQIPKEVLDTPITMLTFRHAKQVRNHMLKVSTAKNYNYAISELSAFWNTGKSEFYRDVLENKENPFANYRIKNVSKEIRKKPKFDDVVQMWKLINEFEIDNYWKTFWKIKICLGCHNTEIIKMTSDNMIEDDMGTWFHWGVGHHKNSNYQNMMEHKIYIHPKLKELIEQFQAEYKPEKYWFYSRSLNWGADKDKMMTNQCPSRRWQRLKKKSGITFASDLFRHALSTFLYTKRLKPEVVTGHCYTGSTQREHYINWHDPDVVAEFKETANTYQQALVDALGDEF